MRRLLVLLLALVALSALLTGCASSAAMDQAHKDGYSDGYEAGYREGYNEGLNNGHDSGYAEGYDKGYNEGQIDGFNRARKTWADSGSSSNKSIANSNALKLLPTAEPKQDYVLNTNTKKFHYPWCSSVDDMAEHNKKYYTGTRQEVIDMGFDPCKRCNP